MSLKAQRLVRRWGYSLHGHLAALDGLYYHYRSQAATEQLNFHSGSGV
jgi:hypothetical protein